MTQALTESRTVSVCCDSNKYIQTDTVTFIPHQMAHTKNKTHTLNHRLCPVAVCRCAEDVTDGSQYFVLLMITDGVISDMMQTKEAVVNVCTQHYPLEITSQHY